MAYTPHTAADVEEMLASIGAKSVDDLFRDVPAELLLKEPLCNMDNFEHQNLCLYQLALHQGRWTVERANDTTHLQPIRLMV